MIQLRLIIRTGKFIILPVFRKEEGVFTNACYARRNLWLNQLFAVAEGLTADSFQRFGEFDASEVAASGEREVPDADNSFRDCNGLQVPAVLKGLNPYVAHSGGDKRILTAEKHRLAVLRKTGVGDAAELRVVLIHRNAFEPGTSAERSFRDEFHILRNGNKYQLAACERPAADVDQPLGKLDVFERTVAERPLPDGGDGIWQRNLTQGDAVAECIGSDQGHSGRNHDFPEVMGATKLLVYKILNPVWDYAFAVDDFIIILHDCSPLLS